MDSVPKEQYVAISKICEQCGGQFLAHPRRAESVRYCCRNCRTAAGRQTLTCMTCKKPFERAKSASKEPIKYCSRACYHADTKGKQHAVKPDAPKYFVICESCSEPFRVTETRKETARFCSRECQGKSAVFAAECSERQQGDKSWRWAGGVYKNRYGYVRAKANVLGVPVIVLLHRKTIRDAMVAADPSHPFLVMVGDELQLRSEIDVHHIDRDRSHNKLQNLLAVTKDAHARIHHFGAKPQPYECWPSDPPKW